MDQVARVARRADATIADRQVAKPGRDARGRLVHALILLLALAPTAASAHVGLHEQRDFLHGFMHPIGGIDHVLAMVAVGLAAALMSGRAIWAVPLSFIAGMAAAGAIGMAGIALPNAEVGIALSVIVFGILVALPVRPTLALMATAVGLFAVCHGYVHGVEMPADSSGLSFGLGFVAAAALLHLLGIGVGTALTATKAHRGWLVRAGGGAFAVAGLAMLTGRVLH
jgi:urease accessory protein